MELDKMAVGPDHFRHGYGTILRKHGMKIPAEDQAPVGVIAAETGTYLYNSPGYETTVTVTLTDPRPGKQASVSLWVQK